MYFIVSNSENYTKIIYKATAKEKS